MLARHIILHVCFHTNPKKRAPIFSYFFKKPLDWMETQFSQNTPTGDFLNRFYFPKKGCSKPMDDLSPKPGTALGTAAGGTL
jgi:hypothetical protein